MKRLRFVLLTLLSVVSCTQKERAEINPKGVDPIRFNAFVANYERDTLDDGEQTKAVTTYGPLTLANLKTSVDGFGATTGGLVGSTQMSNLQVKYSGTALSWGYVGDYFWPINPTQNVTFTGYAPWGLPNVTITPTSFSISTYRPSATPATHIDILYASPATFNRGTHGSTGVPLTFKHLLTQIIFTVSTNISASNNPKVTSLQLTVPLSRGAYASGAWTISSSSRTYTYFSNVALSSTPISSAGTPLLLVPHTPSGNTRIIITLNVNGISYSKTVFVNSLPINIWQPGNSLTYAIFVPKTSIPGATRSDSSSPQELGEIVVQTIGQKGFVGD